MGWKNVKFIVNILRGDILKKGKEEGGDSSKFMSSDIN